MPYLWTYSQARIRNATQISRRYKSENFHIFQQNVESSRKSGYFFFQQRSKFLAILLMGHLTGIQHDTFDIHGFSGI